MNRETIRKLADCPECHAGIGEKCRHSDGTSRDANHLKRLFRAQDIENGKPDRETKAENPDPMADRRCPECRKLLKSRGGVLNHMRDAHGVGRGQAKAQHSLYRKRQSGLLQMIVRAEARSHIQMIDDNDFDVIED